MTLQQEMLVLQEQLDAEWGLKFAELKQLLLEQ